MKLEEMHVADASLPREPLASTVRRDSERVPAPVRSAVFTNGWSDSNKGDAAILLGMVRAFKNCFPGIQLSLISEFSKSDARFEDAHRHLRILAQDVSVLGGLLPYVPISAQRQGAWPMRAAWRAFSLLRAGALLIAPITWRFVLTREQRTAYEAICAADIVVAKGGQFLHSTGRSLHAHVALFRVFFPLLVAARLRVPFMVYPHSFSGFDTRLGSLLARIILNRARVVAVREPLSRHQLRSIGVHAPIEEEPDAAFAVEAMETQRVRRIHSTVQQAARGMPVVAITVRQWFGRDGRYFRALTWIAEAARYLRERGRCVMVVAHCTGPTPGEDDRIAMADLRGLVADDPGIVFVSEDLTAPELAYLYGSSWFLVGTRFHSVILAVAQGTPAIAISYFGPKAQGVMSSLGLDAYVLDLTDLTGLTELLRRLEEDLPFLRRNLKSLGNELRERAISTPGRLLRAGADAR